MSEPLFDPSLKKKKKKAVAFTEDPLGADADPTQPAPETIDNTTVKGDHVDMGGSTLHEQMQNAQHGKEAGELRPVDDDFKSMFGDVKKKKKKKEIPMGLADDLGTSSPTSAPTAAPAATEDLDFSDMKKKKKSTKKKAAFDLEAFEKELNDSRKNKDDGDDDGETKNLDYLNDADLGDDVFAQGDDTGIAGTEAWLNSDRDYTYQELLTRFYGLLHAANPSLLSAASGKRYTVPPPQIHRDGKRCIFANISDICKKMHRQPEHVIQFLFSEMATTGSVDGSGRLVIKGRFQQKQVENVLRQYIMEYVTCKTCRSPDTLLTKENRLFFMSCESCGSRRTVNPIKSGFQAQIGKRSKTRTG